MTVVCPADNVELSSILQELAANPRPAYVRISQYETDACIHARGQHTEIGKAEVLRDTPDAEVALLATGPLTSEAVTVEDHCITGGFGSSVAEYLSERDDSPRVLRLGMPDVYLAADTPAKTLARAGLDANGIASATLARLGR